MAQVLNVGAQNMDILEIRLQVGGAGHSWSDELGLAIAAFGRSHRRSAHLDFSTVDLIDSGSVMQAGGRALSVLRALATVRGGTLHISGASASVERVLYELGGRDLLR